MIRSELILDLNSELIVDNFAGGGGASMGIEMALGRHVDVAVNHDPLAVALHSANHPQTRHLCEDVFKVDPNAITGGRPVGLAWFSPDCKHFSKAKGGKPRSKKIRGLAWVVVKWAAKKKPRVIVLENVEEFQDWGPLRADGMPCPKRKGRTFKSFIKRLQGLGYVVEWRQLRACDFGAPTIRKRLYLIARCDGKPVVWPNATHGDPQKTRKLKLMSWRTAAECIEWGLPCPSIFLSTAEARALSVKRPLAEATMRRLARGVQKFVIETKEPFIVRVAHGEQSPGGVKRWGNGSHSTIKPMGTLTGTKDFALAMPFVTEHANASTQRNFAADEPLRTQCGEVKGGHFALVSPILAGAGGPAMGGKPRLANKPFRTVLAENHSDVVSAFLAKHYGGPREGAGASMPAPMGTVTARDHHSVAAVHLARHFGTAIGADPARPLPTIMPEGVGKTAQVVSFLMKYYGEGGQDQSPAEPLHTVPSRDRFGLVMVEGVAHFISDIGMRMLTPRELYRGQGFPDSYLIRIEVDVWRAGKLKRILLSQEAQVRMCGNSVCPPVAAAIVMANVPEMAIWRNGERKRFEKRLEALCA